jgi:hypothetical protein
MMSQQSKNRKPAELAGFPNYHQAPGLSKAAIDGAFAQMCYIVKTQPIDLLRRRKKKTPYPLWKPTAALTR